MIESGGWSSTPGKKLEIHIQFCSENLKEETNL